MKIIIIGVVPFSLVNFRGDLIKALIREGHEVVAMANNATESQILELSSYGAQYINYPVSRVGLNPISDLRTIYKLIRCFSEESPDCVLSYTIKPTIYGAIAAKFFPKIRFFAMITGLGYAFGDGGFFRVSLRTIILKLYRLALSSSIAVIFQNPDDKEVFVDLKLIPISKSFVVNGSGVNLKRFAYHGLNDKKAEFHFLIVARLLKNKGITNFLEAAEIVKATRRNVKFSLVGAEDDSPNAFPIKVVEDYHRRGVISYIGELDDVRETLVDCSAFVLPSRSGEGVPRSLLEALAIGRAVITTDTPGCRKTVIDGKNGFLVSPRDSNDLADKMLMLIDTGSNILEMGFQSRKLAEEVFDVDLVNKDIIRIISPRPSETRA